MAHAREKSLYTHKYILSWGYGWCSTFMFPKMVEILMEKFWKYWTIGFSSFWHYLGFGGCAFCCFILISKSTEKLFFPAFGRILVLVAVLFPVQILIEKVLKIWFCQFFDDLVGLGGSFACWIFNWQNIQKLIFPALGRILVLAAAFSCTSAWKVPIYTHEMTAVQKEDRRADKKIWDITKRLGNETQKKKEEKQRLYIFIYIFINIYIYIFQNQSKVVYKYILKR